MIYIFKSKAAGDVIMLGPHGDQVLQLMGRESAAKGIFEVKDMPSYLSRLEAAVTVQPAGGANEGKPEESSADPVALRARIWPLVEMMRTALKANQPIVWGV